jgi:3-isopropylmalate/(R)-2-methylmalate dehydratase small subunit
VQAFTTLTGRAAPLLLANVDTDVIVRIERFTNEPREALGRYAFEALRYRPDGGEDESFVLNRPPYRGAPILIAGPNFGCGSSREGAVWALQGLGIRCVIAPSFGDIFFSNCFQNGVLPIRLPLAQVNALAALAETGRSFTVDLERCVLLTPDGSSLPFQVDSLRRQSLLEGLDEIGLTLKHADAIAAWQAADRAAHSWRWPAR